MPRHKLVCALLLVALLAACRGPGGASPAGDATYPTELNQVPRITPEELKSLLDAGQKVVIVDSRALKPYEVRHLPGAISMPLTEVDERYGELSKDSKIVIYCT